MLETAALRLSAVAAAVSSTADSSVDSGELRSMGIVGDDRILGSILASGGLTLSAVGGAGRSSLTLAIRSETGKDRGCDVHEIHRTYLAASPSQTLARLLHSRSAPSFRAVAFQSLP